MNNERRGVGANTQPSVNGTGLDTHEAGQRKRRNLDGLRTRGRLPVSVGVAPDRRSPVSRSTLPLRCTEGSPFAFGAFPLFVARITASLNFLPVIRVEND